MGTDKRFLTVEGQTLLQRGIGLLQTTCAEVIVCIRSGEEPITSNNEDVRWLPDHVSFAGPLHAIGGAICHCKHPWCLIHACDMPHISVELIQSLQRATIDNQADVVLASLQGRLQVLPALVSAHIAEKVEAHLGQGGQSLRGFWSKSDVDVATIDLAANDAHQDWRHVFRNINTPTDFDESS